MSNCNIFVGEELRTMSCSFIWDLENNTIPLTSIFEKECAFRVKYSRYCKHFQFSYYHALKLEILWKSLLSRWVCFCIDIRYRLAFFLSFQLKEMLIEMWYLSLFPKNCRCWQSYWQCTLISYWFWHRKHVSESNYFFCINDWEFIYKRKCKEERQFFIKSFTNKSNLCKKIDWSLFLEPSKWFVMLFTQFFID